MAEPFLSEIRIMSFSFPPKGWAQCNGQLLPINQNQALFALVGTMYGGNGQTTFALPNLQGRTPIHRGGSFVQGQSGGEENHTLSAGELAAHAHPVAASSASADSPSPAGSYWASAGGSHYAGAPGVSMAGVGASAGGGQPHPNLSPYLTLNFCIALQGLFPSQN